MLNLAEDLAVILVQLPAVKDVLEIAPIRVAAVGDVQLLVDLIALVIVMGVLEDVLALAEGAAALVLLFVGHHALDNATDVLEHLFRYREGFIWLVLPVQGLVQ